jgi:hypothetical protein
VLIYVHSVLDFSIQHELKRVHAHGVFMQSPAETIKSLSFVFLLFSVLVLSGCSSGSSSGTTPAQPALPAYLNLSLSPSSVMPGQSATLSWTSGNATSCTASGAWSGTLQSAGSMNVILQAATAQTYSVLCSGTAGSITKAVTLAPEGACSATPAVKGRHVPIPRAIAAARRAVATGTAGPRRSGGQ